MAREELFGTVANGRVVYFHGKGLFRGGSREDVSLKHVTSVRVDTKRNPVRGIICFLASLILFSIEEPVGLALGLLLLVAAIMALWGSTLIVINTADGDKRPMESWPWHKQEAEEFVEAVRSQIFPE